MDVRTLHLDPAEREFLAATIAAEDVWPPHEGLGALLQQVPGGEIAGGPHLRATLIALAVRARSEGDRPLDVTAGELWLIDSALMRRDLRREKLPDGRPLAELASKVWELLLSYYEDRLPLDLRKEPTHARDEDADADTGAIVASAEALIDPDTVREPAEICPQQRREEGWEAV